MEVPFSENLAILSIICRSLRIRKMFEARDIYWIEGKIPKKMINKFSEK